MNTCPPATGPPPELVPQLGFALLVSPVLIGLGRSAKSAELVLSMPKDTSVPVALTIKLPLDI